MLQGSPSRCNWGILWDSPIIRWDRSICWIIRIGVEGSFRILQGFVGIVRFVESFELWLRDPLGFFGIPEGFLRNSWGIFWKLAIGNLSNHFHQLVMGFLRISWRSSIVFQPFFFLSFSFTSSFCAFTSAVVEFYLFIFFLCCHQDVVDWDSLMILYGDSLRDQSNATSLKVLIALWLDYCAALSVLFMTRSPRGHNTPTSHLTMLTRHVT